MTENSPPDPDVESTMAAASRLLADIVAGSYRPLRSLRLRSPTCSVEIEWADSDQEPVPPPAAGHPPPAPEIPNAAGADVGRPAQDEYLRAPMVGVFYAAPSPDSEPFVRVGDLVRVGQQVAILEAMKVMVPVEAERAGRIADVVARDGAAVEYGAPLYRIDPRPA